MLIVGSSNTLGHEAIPIAPSVDLFAGRAPSKAARNAYKMGSGRFLGDIVSNLSNSGTHFRECPPAQSELHHRITERGSGAVERAGKERRHV